MLIIRKQKGRSVATTKDRVQLNEVLEWLRLKGRKVREEHKWMISRLPEVVGGYINVDVELDDEKFCIYLITDCNNRAEVDKLHRGGVGIVIDSPVPTYPGLIRISFKST